MARAQCPNAQSSITTNSAAWNHAAVAQHRSKLQPRNFAKQSYRQLKSDVAFESKKRVKFTSTVDGSETARPKLPHWPTEQPVKVTTDYRSTD
jgi:hypothetical protein